MWRRRLLALGAVGATLVAVGLVAVWLAPSSAKAPDGPATTRPVFAAGDNSGNIPLNRSRRRVVNRWAARHTGLIQALHLRVRTAGASACEDDPGEGYGGGNSGRWASSTHPVRDDGTPDLGVTLAKSVFRPCDVKRGGAVRVPLDLPVVTGELYATVVRNVDSDPKRNFFSQNYLYASAGLKGANGRNELGADAADTYYGLDPREAVGFSTDGGARWSIPGGPYGPRDGRAFIPTFLQEYEDGFFDGQPLYSATEVDGQVIMVYKQTNDATITQIGAYTSGAGRAVVTLSVDGREARDAVLSGRGHLRVAVEPLRVRAGQTITLRTVAGRKGLDLLEQYAGAVWARYAKLGPNRPVHLERDPTRVAPIFPLFRVEPAER